MRFLKIVFHLFWIVTLTILTQVGGFIWILSVILWKTKKWRKKITFPLFYLIFNLIIIPPLAKQFGREQLPIFNENIKPRNLFYPLLFRNYVTPNLRNVLLASSKELKKSNINITYLDANFPFYNGFPLLPHRSHNDGKKIDIAFAYKTLNGENSDKKPSISGYGVYVQDDNYTAKACLKKGNWQYGIPKYLTLGTINYLSFDAKNTKNIILSFLSQPQTEKIFIEPYLKTSLSLSSYSKIRFHGCKAVRHDDHIHLQVK